MPRQRNNYWYHIYMQAYEANQFGIFIPLHILSPDKTISSFLNIQLFPSMQPGGNSRLRMIPRHA